MKQQIDYKQYLASREWRVKRKEVIEDRGGICERCASRPIQNVHHLTYERVGQEHSDDLMGVCRPCHEYLAAERDDDPALEAIERVIHKHGLFPVMPWPKGWEYPTFVSGKPENERLLQMELVPKSYDRIIQDFFRGLPNFLICDDVLAFFSWIRYAARNS